MLIHQKAKTFLYENYQTHLVDLEEDGLVHLKNTYQYITDKT